MNVMLEKVRITMTESDKLLHQVKIVGTMQGEATTTLNVRGPVYGPSLDKLGIFESIVEKAGLVLRNPAFLRCFFNVLWFVFKFLSPLIYGEGGGYEVWNVVQYRFPSAFFIVQESP